MQLLPSSAHAFLYNNFVHLILISIIIILIINITIHQFISLLMMHINHNLIDLGTYTPTTKHTVQQSIINFL